MACDIQQKILEWATDSHYFAEVSKNFSTLLKEELANWPMSMYPNLKAILRRFPDPLKKDIVLSLPVFQKTTQTLKEGTEKQNETHENIQPEISDKPPDGKTAPHHNDLRFWAGHIDTLERELEVAKKISESGFRRTQQLKAENEELVGKIGRAEGKVETLEDSLKYEREKNAELEKRIQDIILEHQNAEKKITEKERQYQYLEEKHRAEIENLNQRSDGDIQYNIDVLKNRIASALKAEFDEIQNLEKQNLSEGIEKHLFIKMKNIFKKLKRENIDFSK